MPTDKCSKHHHHCISLLWHFDFFPWKLDLLHHKYFSTWEELTTEGLWKWQQKQKSFHLRITNTHIISDTCNISIIKNTVSIHTNCQYLMHFNSMHDFNNKKHSILIHLLHLYFWHYCIVTLAYSCCYTVTEQISINPLIRDMNLNALERH